MEIFNILIFIFMIIALVFLLKNQFNKTNVNVKPKVIKKSEIVDDYKKIIIDIIDNNKDNKNELTIQKKQALKVISKELHNNIFFDEDEIREIIKKLASL